MASTDIYTAQTGKSLLRPVIYNYNTNSLNSISFTSITPKFLIFRFSIKITLCGYEYLYNINTPI